MPVAKACQNVGRTSVIQPKKQDSGNFFFSRAELLHTKKVKKITCEVLHTNSTTTVLFGDNKTELTEIFVRIH